MNIGIYNFKTMKLNKIIRMVKLLNFNTEDVFIYSENKNKEQIKHRKGLINIIDDYKSGIIDIIVFDSFKSLGTNDYINCEVLKVLLDNNCRFFCVYDKDFNYRNKSFILTMIQIKEKMKEDADERSKRGQIEKKKKL